MTMMTRDDARAAFAASGLTYADLTDQTLTRLREAINVALKAEAADNANMRITGRTKIEMNDTGDVTFVDMTCRSNYFDKRQAVTFNQGGFIGFAGWADDANVAPILQAFTAWTAELVLEKSADPVEPESDSPAP
jgi:hypothetical protein